MELDRQDADEIERALSAALAFFELRDQMNARVHTPDTVRWSPITERMRSALTVFYAAERSS